jgi:hypothetical protein
MFDQISVLYQIHTQDKCIILLFTAFYIYCLFIEIKIVPTVEKVFVDVCTSHTDSG